MQHIANTSPDDVPHLRLWPGIAATTIGWLLQLVAPVIAPEQSVVGILGGVVCGLLVLVWWLLFSRAPVMDRLGSLVLMLGAVPATRLILHESIQGGMMGRMFYIVVIPALGLALAAGAWIGRSMSDSLRRASMGACILAACGVFALLRTDGIMGEGTSLWRWRWTQTAEQQLLALREPALPPVAEHKPVEEKNAETTAPAEGVKATPVNVVQPATVEATDDLGAWTGFRGPQRNSVVTGVKIKTDWSASPPAELWRKPVGPGWSSFAVRGGLIYTQEQRGEHEVIACYNLKTGVPVWAHRDVARFWESNGGAGPRGTPTLDGNRLYALGATGIVNALDAATGAAIWQRNAAEDTGAKLPEWGFTSSPLVVNDVVLVATSGRLAAYDTSNGEKRWTRESGGGSYSSPQLLTIGGVEQAVFLHGKGAMSVVPANGTVLWQHDWEGAKILQPAVLADGDLLITSGDAFGGMGTRRLAVKRVGEEWKVEEGWTSKGLKPYFNDLVVHGGYAYGFDGSILACIDLKDGTRKWKGGRYGHGQLVLLKDQDLLLVLSEEGEVALVAASPAGYQEKTRFRAMDGKTWNHPVVVSNVLIVRNGEEMVAYRLGTEGS